MQKVYTDRIHGLRKRYISSLEAKRGAIGLAWQGLKANPENVEQSEFRELIHKLAGSAGSYDLDDISAHAKLIHSSLADQPRLDDALAKRVDQELERLSEIIARTL